MRPLISREQIGDVGLVLAVAALALAATVGWSNDFRAYPTLAAGIVPAMRPLELGALFSNPTAVLVMCLPLCWRRRRPFMTALILIPTAMIVPAAAPAALVALFSVAAARSRRVTAWFTGLALTPVLVTLLVQTVGGQGLELLDLASMLLSLALVTGAVGWGLVVSSRRERIAQARRETELRAQRAQQQAREDIAREMHDVLAHRLSLLSIHAGALEVAPDAPAADVQHAAGVIRASAHQALEDLREIIGVLRSATLTGTAEDRPQPTLEDLPALLEEAREAGTPTTVELCTAERTDIPTATGRTAYRIVQEGLTNARKHAPGAPVEVVLRGGPGEGLTIRITNPIPNRSSGTAPKSTASGDGHSHNHGHGLIGLAERATLAGGTLLHHNGQDFRLTAWLPWAGRPTATATGTMSGTTTAPAAAAAPADAPSPSAPLPEITGAAA